MAIGFTLYWPAYLGALPWLGSKTPSFVADVGRAGEAQAADHLRREVADDVAEEIRRHQDAVALGILQQPHGDGVDVGVVHRDAGVLLRDALAGLEEHALGGAHHVGLVDDGDLGIAVLLRVLEGGADDPVAALPRVDLAGDGELVARNVGEVRERLAQLDERRLQLVGDRVELDAGVEALGVLAEDHEVDAFLVVQRVARDRPCRAAGR